MDKVLFLFSKDEYTQSYVNSLSRNQCENFAKDSDYVDSGNFVKIDARKYKDVEETLIKEGFFGEDWYMKAFGF